MYEATLRIASLTIFSCLTLISATATAQLSPTRPDEPVYVVEAFTLVHQPAGDAVEIVRSLLSPRGRVELQGDSNTLVVRDAEQYVDQARAVLESFDHRVMNIAFTVRVVEASMGSEASDPDLPPRLILSMQNMLSYKRFEERGRAEIVGSEGQDVAYRIGSDFRVEFNVGTVLDSRRLKLNDFQVFRLGEGHSEKPLIHTRLVIRLGQILVLGLARSEDSGKALMVVIHTVPIVISPPLGDNPKPR